jgi:tetratricopeptide (TPR) repeat protein
MFLSAQYYLLNFFVDIRNIECPLVPPCSGNIPQAIETFRQAIQTSADPWYSQFPKLALCLAAINNGQVEEALPLLDQMIAFSDSNGTEFVGEPARFFKALAAVFEGRADEGIESMEGLLKKWEADGSRLRVVICGFALANAYSQLQAKASQRRDAPVMPSESLWAEKAIQQFKTVADEAADIGAAALHGRALFGLGDVLASLGRQEEAKQAIARSIELLETIHADGHLMQARKLLETI